MHYYNENDPYTSNWLKKLIANKIIPDGDVDTRSIKDVCASDVLGYTQCHFFAGIAGWSYALQLAKWPINKPVWTGSCPCQPFSVQGDQKGFKDDRHLWPEFFRLIKECNPATIFGEQVASPLGKQWLAHVRADLEKVGYAVGAADLCAASLGAPHIRQRLYWVGHSVIEGSQRWGLSKDEYSDQWDIKSAGCDVWSTAEWRVCEDGRSRLVKPGILPMANGIPERVGRIFAYGNAVVPQLAATFIQAAI
jgi:DNA (cytosine-5)-methyltransferase 1